MKYTLHFESGAKGFNTLHEAKQASRRLTKSWKITRGSYVIVGFRNDHMEVYMPVETLCEEHGFRDCSVCFHDQPGIPSTTNDGFQEWLHANSQGMEGEDDAETLMHVAWRAALISAKT